MVLGMILYNYFNLNFVLWIQKQISARSMITSLHFLSICLNPPLTDTSAQQRGTRESQIIHRCDRKRVVSSLLGDTFESGKNSCFSHKKFWSSLPSGPGSMDCDENDFVGGFSLALCTANRAPV